MDLKLKDEIIGLLIESPGLSVSELAKKTKNYYSYTHKIITQLQNQKILEIKKIKKGKKMLTTCYVSKTYKKIWIKKLKNFFTSQMKDAEIKAAFLLSYSFLILKTIQSNIFKISKPVLARNNVESIASDAIIENSLENFSTIKETFFRSSLELYLLTLITLLLIIYFYKKRNKTKPQ